MPGSNAYDDIIRAAMKPQPSAVPNPVVAPEPYLPGYLPELDGQGYDPDTEPQYKEEIKRALYSMGLLKPGQPAPLPKAGLDVSGMRPSTMIDDRRNEQPDERLRPVYTGPK